MDAIIGYRVIHGIQHDIVSADFDLVNERAVQRIAVISAPTLNDSNLKQVFAWPFQTEPEQLSNIDYSETVFGIQITVEVFRVTLNLLTTSTPLSRAKRTHTDQPA